MQGGQRRSAVLRGLVTLRGDGAETEHEAGYTLPAIAGKILAPHRLAGLEHLVRSEHGAHHRNAPSHQLGVVPQRRCIFILIRPVWGNSAHSGSRRIEQQDFPGDGLAFEPGDELARFAFGSTAILLLPSGVPPLMPGFQAGRTVRLGEKLAITRAERGRL